MKVTLVVTLFLLFIVLSKQSILPRDFHNISNKDQLVAVAVCFRHGDRAPSSSFPNDPYLDIKYWPNGLGQLLNAGKTHQYKLGRWLRNRYDGFLSKKYLPTEMFVKSTNVQRTVESAQYNLKGLYNLEYDLVSIPIPIYTRPDKSDEVLAMRMNCNNYNHLYEATLYSEYFKNILKKHEYIKQNIEKNTGWKITDINYFKEIYLVFDIYRMHNVSYLPEWGNEIDKKELAYLAGMAFAVDTFYPSLQRLKVGPFFNYLHNYFDGVIDGKNPRFLMLSAHDGTIASILNSYSAYDYKPPEFCSTIIWELYKDSKGYFYLNILFKKNTETESLDVVKVNDCLEKCSYSDYKTYLMNVTVDFDTWKKECDLNKLEN